VVDNEALDITERALDWYRQCREIGLIFDTSNILLY